MGQVITPGFYQSGTYTPSFTSLYNNAISTNPFFYSRNGNIVTLTGSFNWQYENSYDDELYFTLPISYNDFSNGNQVSGTYSIVRPHEAFTNPVEMGPVNIISAAQTISLQFNTQLTTGSPNFIFNLSLQYIIV